MDEWLSRQRRLLGDEACAVLARARVAIAGLGGVGGAAFEALVRAGVGSLAVCDCDVFERSNLNRQILATESVLGERKVTAARARAMAINPSTDIAAIDLRLDEGNLSEFLEPTPDYVIDAIDSVSAKIALIEECLRRGVPIISCMGTGNRLFADFEIVDIEKTANSGCPLARVMRHELRSRAVERGVTVLCGKTPPIKPPDGGRSPASISFVPPIAGYMLAGHVVRELIK
ncbi:MAG: ThiF family adenylyltransferase [Oscillospiraceae bacterium]